MSSISHASLKFTGPAGHEYAGQVVTHKGAPNAFHATLSPVTDPVRGLVGAPMWKGCRKSSKAAVRALCAAAKREGLVWNEYTHS